MTVVREWSKDLTRSDGQQETAGALMPFLRFTRSGMPHDHRTWFREVFFDDLDWQQDSSPLGLPRERAEVKLHVTIRGAELGVCRMWLDHIPERARNNSAPTTHLHYDPETREALESENHAGRQIVVSRYSNGQYALEVR